MIRFVNAKVNLGLHVLARRADGYHELRTIFYPVGMHCGTPADPGRLCDVLEATRAPQDAFRQTGMAVECPEDKNLVVRARSEFRRMAGIGGPVSITLEKHLPSQAGLGGGSADAAFTLRMLNEMEGSPLSDGALAEAALRLGADCPFFIYNRPALASGIGEVLEPLPERLSLGGMWMAVVKPEAGISTREAFALLDAPRELFPADALAEGVREWRTPEEMLASPLLVNDFEGPMFALHPELRALKEHLYGTSALYASMSGSGSAFFGIYRTRELAESAAATAPVPYATVALL